MQCSIAGCRGSFDKYLISILLISTLLLQLFHLFVKDQLTAA